MIEADTKLNLASQWKQRLAEQAAAREPEITTETELAGFRFIGRRVPLQSWIRAGKLPQGILRQIFSDEKKDIEISPAELSADELIQSIEFQRDCVCTAVVEPKIVAHDGPLAEDEIRYADLCVQSPELVEAVLSWALAGSPNIPVKTEEGEVSVDALARFQQERTERASVGVGVDGEQVSSAA